MDRLLRSLSGYRGILRVLIALSTLALIVAAPAAHATPAARPNTAATSGGSISVRNGGPVDCLDTAKTSGGFDYYITQEIDDTLTAIDAKGKVQPSLATGWQISHGGKWITVFLRHGVRFSNGDPFTAHAVWFTFHRALAPGFSAGTASLIGPLRTLKVINPYTVRFIMKQPYRPILPNLSFVEFGILDPRASSNVCKHPVGTGPYMIKSVGPGYSTVTLVRNPYRTWEPAWTNNHGRPYLNQITFKNIVTDATAVSELLSGGVQISNIAGTQLSRVQGNHNFVLHRTVSQDLQFLGFNTSHAPFNSVAVRRAISEAIDRNALIKAALNGLGVPAYSTLAKTIPYYDPKAPSYAVRYNPSDAQKVLSANHVSGPYTLLVWDYAGMSTAAELIQAELAQVGVKVNIVVKDFAGFAPIARAGNFDMDLFAYGDFDADIYGFEWASNQIGPSGFNFSFYRNSTLDNLITKGRQSLNPKVAARVYAQIQRFMSNNAIVDPLWTSVTINAVRKNIKGYHVLSVGSIVFQDLYLGK